MLSLATETGQFTILLLQTGQRMTTRDELKPKQTQAFFHKMSSEDSAKPITRDNIWYLDEKATDNLD